MYPPQVSRESELINAPVPTSPDISNRAVSEPPAIPGARVSLVLLILINLVNYIDRYVLSAVETLIRKDFFGDADKGTHWYNSPMFLMGSLAPAFLVTYMLAAPVFGWLGDRFRRWTIIGLGVLLWSLATGWCGLAGGFWMLFLARILVGIGEAAWGPIAPTIIADMYPVSRRGWVLSWFYLALPVGSALGVILGGQVAAWLSWHWAFFVVTPPGIALGLWALTRKDPPRGGSDPSADTSKMPLSGALRELLRNRSYVMNTLGMAAMTFAIGGMSFWMPTYIHEYRMHGGSDEAGRAQLAMIARTFGGITVVAGLAGTLIGGWAGDKLRGKIRGAYFAFSGWTMLAAFPLFVLVLLLPFPWAWVPMFAAIFMIFLGTGPTNTIIANVTRPTMRSTAFAVNILAIHTLGDAVSPPLIGLVTDRSGSMNIAFGLVGLAIVVSGLVLIRGARYLDDDTRAASGA